MQLNHVGDDLPAAAAQPERLVFDQALLEERDYWTRRLSREGGDANLRLDNPRPGRLSGSMEVVPIVFDDALGERIARVTGGGAFLLYALLLGAVKVCLHKYTASPTVTVGSPPRHDGEPERAPENLVPIVDEVDDRCSFREFLLQVRQTLLEAYSRQRYPFQRLVKDLGVPVESNRCPLFDVIVTLKDIHGRALAANNDVTVIFEKGSDKLRGRILYRPELFARSTVERFQGHLLKVLEAMLDDPNSAIAEASIMSEAERRQLLVDWNDTHVDYRQNTVGRWFEVQVERTPGAMAVICGQDALTYRDLNARANQLAHYLRAAGVRCGVPVVICLEPGLHLVVAVLAVLKAGGAYVPVDPAYPPERQALMVADIQAPVLLTERRFAGNLPASQSRVIELDTAWQAVATCSAENPAWTVTGEDLAYVIYTSGSTGRPKGAGVHHRGLANLLSWFIDEFKFTSDDRILLISSFSFDLTQKNIFAPLLVGGQLHLLQSDYFDVADVATSVAESAITSLNCTPSVFYPLADALASAPAAAVGSLRHVFLGGEPISVRRLWEYASRKGAAEIVNTYGPTECSDVSAFYRLRPLDRLLDAAVPIGRPVANTQSFILDRHQAPCPVGVVGELCVGGVGVGMGYLGNADLTAERFVPNPFAAQAGSRLYRTGDLARYLPDGNIEYLGREDRQVKLRGFRIEMAEVEAALRQHAAVREAAVAVRQYAPGDQRLVAYVVPDEAEALPVCRLLRLEREGRMSRSRRYELPNGMVIAHLNRSETDFVYREMFDEQSYLKHGVTLDDGASIFDVGANIGLFALYANRLCDGAKVYAFEPIPPVFDVLRLNMSLYGVTAELLDYGIASQSGTATFSYYPHASILSGRFADAAEERETVRNYLLTPGDAGETAVRPQDVDELLEERLTAERFKCSMKTLSQAMRENGVERIDLLKVDVEKSELDVLSGIDSADWPKIRQVVVEVHDTDGRLQQIRALLERHGFTVAVEQDTVLRATAIYSVYAVRSEEIGAAAPRSRRIRRSEPPAGWRWSSPDRLVADIRRSMQAKLPDHMVPAAVVLLPGLPLTPSGKVDVRALPLPETGLLREGEFVAPRNAIEEEVGGIWSDVLQLEGLGIHDDFFRLGGHSLLATQVVSRLRDAFQVKLPLRDFFAGPTIAELAISIAKSLAQRADGVEVAELLAQLENVPEHKEQAYEHQGRAL